MNRAVIKFNNYGKFNFQNIEQPYAVFMFFNKPSSNQNYHCKNNISTTDITTVFNIASSKKLRKANANSKLSKLGYNFITVLESSTFDENNKKENFRKLKELSEFKNNWNGNNAVCFSSCLIEKVYEILSVVPIQPEIFPTANNSIQLEYDNSKGDYLEFEVFEDKIKKFFYGSDNTSRTTMLKSIRSIKNTVSKFYE